MSLAKLKNEAEILECEIELMNNQLKKIRQNIAEQLCPFEVGDSIVNTEDRSQKAVVYSIRSGWKGFDVTVNKIKKDGDLYKYTNDLWNPEKWEKETKCQRNTKI